MPIHPLPQFEADVKAQEEDRRAYEKLKIPKTMVVRFGYMKMIGEFPYEGDTKPGCGSKMVIRTFRGTEIGEMLTSTCPNAGCSKSVTRQEMLDYIEASGGRDYPFFNDGRVLRVATAEDMDKQARLEQSTHELKMDARRRAEQRGLPMKIVEAEPILGGERLTFFFTSEERVDFRELVRELGAVHKTRIEMRQVGARDEARLTADYERCGEYCCCKNFLKVLKPVSMRSAKVQKATLDPLKISGRCGRLMCCLRYEDSTYEDLRKRLPKRKSHVGTPEGDGIVLDTQILTQLALIRLDEDGREVAVPVEELTKPGEGRPDADTTADRGQSSDAASTGDRRGGRGRSRDQSRDRGGDRTGDRSGRPAARRTSPDTETVPSRDKPDGGDTDRGDGPAEGREGPPGSGGGTKRRRRRRKKTGGGGGPGSAGAGGAGGGQDSGGTASEGPRQREPGSDGGSGGGSASGAGGAGASGASGGEGGGEGARRKRRRRRRKRPGEGGPGSSDSGGGDASGGGSGGGSGASGGAGGS